MIFALACEWVWCGEDCGALNDPPPPLYVFVIQQWRQHNATYAICVDVWVVSNVGTPYRMILVFLVHIR